METKIKTYISYNTWRERERERERERVEIFIKNTQTIMKSLIILMMMMTSVLCGRHYQQKRQIQIPTWRPKLNFFKKTYIFYNTSRERERERERVEIFLSKIHTTIMKSLIILMMMMTSVEGIINKNGQSTKKRVSFRSVGVEIPPPKKQRVSAVVRSILIHSSYASI